MNREQVRELLDRTHDFPTFYTIKAIGESASDFVSRVLLAARHSLAREVHMRHSVRSTARGAHVAVTLDIMVQSADEVLEVYEALEVVGGMKFLM
jgi:putative lipoic acid-binding regulatory protein